MPNKPYQIAEEAPLIAAEPAVAYQRTAPLMPFEKEKDFSTSDRWNPNVPFHGTQDEWWEHFHRIEEGEFMSIEEADKEFELWKKEFLASRM